MKVAVFSTKPYDRRFLDAANHEGRHELVYFEPRLIAQTARLAEGYDAVCVFVNDVLDDDALSILAELGVRQITLRCAGFNNVAIDKARKLGLTVTRVPAYSPHSVAEHTLALYLALNRKIVQAHNRVREGNFSLEGLLGFDTYGKTVGLIGTGLIGTETTRLFKGLGCELLGYDIRENPACLDIGLRYVSLETLFQESDIISLHCPLLKATHHIINAKTIAQMKDGVVILNTSRGGLIDAQAVIAGLKAEKIGLLGLDVYEEEEALFFEDRSTSILKDDVFARLTTFSNVLVTGHQAFFTSDALTRIAETTIGNLNAFAAGTPCSNAVEV